MRNCWGSKRTVASQHSLRNAPRDHCHPIQIEYVFGKLLWCSISRTRALLKHDVHRQRYSAYCACLRRTPARRKPRIGLMLIRLNSGVMITNAPRNLRKSRPNGDNWSDPELHEIRRQPGDLRLQHNLLKDARMNFALCRAANAAGRRASTAGRGACERRRAKWLILPMAQSMAKDHNVQTNLRA
jgi:hypothetical protein